jgi:hypothetical protein
MRQQSGMVERSAQVLGSLSGGTPAGLERFNFPGLLIARRGADPRTRNSGLPCRSVWLRLFSSQRALLDDFCAQRKLHSPEAIYAVLGTFTSVYVRALQVIDLAVARIPRDEPVYSHILDSGKCRDSESWSIVKRCLAAVDGGHPEGVIVQDDRAATSIFIAQSAVYSHTTLDRLPPMSLVELLEERAAHIAAA